MTPNFFNLSYLPFGSAIQLRAFEVIQRSRVMTILRDYDPVLVGTLPLDIFIEGSDLDILCCIADLPSAKKSGKKISATTRVS